MATEHDISTLTPRVATLVTLVSLCRAQRQQRYYVRRGPINWATFDFERHPYAIAILTPEFSLKGDQHGVDQCTVTLELCQKMPDEALDRDQRRDGLDDVGLESLVEDVVGIVSALELAAYPNNDFLCSLLRFSKDRPPVQGQEMSNDNWSVQGIQATFTITY